MAHAVIPDPFKVIGSKTRTAKTWMPLSWLGREASTQSSPVIYREESCEVGMAGARVESGPKVWVISLVGRSEREGEDRRDILGLPKSESNGLLVSHGGSVGF